MLWWSGRAKFMTPGYAHLLSGHDFLFPSLRTHWSVYGWLELLHESPPACEEGLAGHQTFNRQQNKYHVWGFLLVFLPTAKTWTRRETLQEEGALPF